MVMALRPNLLPASIAAPAAMFRPQAVQPVHPLVQA
jgi:hypothetical protein